MDLKRPSNCLKNKIKTEENINETVKHFLKKNIHNFSQEMSAIEKSTLKVQMG